jgi:hypothetical protein
MSPPVSFAGSFDRGGWALHHRDEVIASYFIPLPEPLGFPNAWFLPLYEQPPATETERLRAGGGFVLVPLSEDAVPEPAVVGGSEYELPSDERNWSNKHVLRSSLMLHLVGTNFITRASIDAAHAVANRATGGKYNAEEVEPLVVGFVGQGSIPDDVLRESLAAGVGAVTVAEVAVPLHILGAVPSDLECDFADLSKSEDKDALPSRQAWPEYAAESDFANQDDYRAELAKRALNGLRMAIADLRDLQSAYHAATRTPVTLMTFELLPPILPVGFRQLRDVGTPETATIVSATTHRNLWAWLAPPELTPEQFEQFAHAQSRTDRMVFAGHLDLHREADVARQRDGDTRAAAIYAGLAAEALLDELLLHLMWEEALRPEDAASAWRDGLLSRVRRDYADRLGGDWDITSTGAVGRWSRECADLRHRAVHGGYLPSYAELEGSLAALNGLVTYVCDRLCLPARLRHYPRTALALAGPPGLKRRSQYSRRLTELQADPNETKWDATFARWKEAFRKIRRQGQGFPRVPVVADSDLIAVARPSGAKYYCVSHRETGLAAEVTIDPLASEKSPHFGVVADWLAGIDVSGYQQAGLSMGVHNDDPTLVSLQGEWVEAYRLLPLGSVMVDKSDLK